jgi:hypothetical protein
MSLLVRLMKSARRVRHDRPETLYDIFLRNDRGDLHKWHHYFDIYERFLAPFRGVSFKFLEIGLWRGGSLRMWREYFGTSAAIYGMDIEPSCTEFQKQGFRIFIGNQADKAFLREVKTELQTLDVVIDDGGHTATQQINTFEELYPITKQLYIVEDTHTSYWPKYLDAGSRSFLDFAKEKVDVLHEWHRSPQSFALHSIPPVKRPSAPTVSDFCAQTRAMHFYDSVVVFEKGDNKPRWHEVR